MPKELFYKAREIESQLDYGVFLDECNTPSEEVLEQLEVVREMIEALILNIKENEK